MCYDSGKEAGLKRLQTFDSICITFQQKQSPTGGRAGSEVVAERNWGGKGTLGYYCVGLVT